jgi:hypothetical protein
MSTAGLLVLAAEKYNLRGIELGVLTSVRRGGKIPPMWNVPLIIYESFLVHRMLVVLMPGQIGLSRPACCAAKARPEVSSRSSADHTPSLHACYR